jgi:hypothetical protein
VTVRGDLTLIVMAGLVVVRRTMLLTPSSSCIARVASETKIVRVRRPQVPRDHVTGAITMRPIRPSRRD